MYLTFPMCQHPRAYSCRAMSLWYTQTLPRDIQYLSGWTDSEVLPPTVWKVRSWFAVWFYTFGALQST